MQFFSIGHGNYRAINGDVVARIEYGPGYASSSARDRAWTASVRRGREPAVTCYQPTLQGARAWCIERAANLAPVTSAVVDATRRAGR